MDIGSILLSLGTNILSSMVYDIGKAFVSNGNQSLTEEQVLGIICSFQNELDEMLLSQSDIEDRMDLLQRQNEIILKLLLAVFCERSIVRIVHTEDGYRLDGEYTLDGLNDEADACLNDYLDLLHQADPETLGEAVWPIPADMKEVLLDEIQQSLYSEE